MATILSVSAEVGRDRRPALGGRRTQVRARGVGRADQLARSPREAHE